jgi:DNA-directed RNA polymerase subunit RPC12/RpoP
MNAPMKCPKCGTIVRDTAAVYVIHDPNDAAKVDARILTYTCHKCGVSFTEEVREREPAGNLGR